MNWLDITQILLLILACYGCFQAGTVKGINDAFNFCVNERLIDKAKLEEKLKEDT